MDAVASLLRGLPLQPEESDRGDLMEAKSQMFLKYFTLFMNLLNDCTEVSEMEKEVVVGSRSRVGVGVGVGVSGVASSRLANLRNSTIQVSERRNGKRQRLSTSHVFALCFLPFTTGHV